MNTIILDVGTSSMRGTLFQDDGKKLLSVQVKYQIAYNSDGIVEQDAKELEKAVYHIISQISEKASQLGASIQLISVTAQRSSVVPVDKQGEPLTPFIMWQDIRNRSICNRLKHENEQIFRLSGSFVNTVFSGSKMTWIKENQEKIYNRAYKILNVPEYLMYILTGNYRTDYTYGSRSNLMNIKTCRWDPELLRLFDVKEEKLCELMPPGSIIGSVCPVFARRTGIQNGIPVISAGGDQQCAVIGQGAYQEGRISIVTGTGAFLATTSNSVPDNLLGDVICNASSISGRYILEANVLTCCSAFDWFCRNFYEQPFDYEKIALELEKQYKYDSECLVLPYFQGRSTPDWNAGARASFHNLTLSTDRGELLKSLLNGIFMEIKNNLDNLKRYVPVEKGFISGGLTNTAIINQMQSDMYGIPLCRMDDCESTSTGALLVSLVAQGVYQNIEQAYQKVRGNMAATMYTPNDKCYEINCKKQKRMKELYLFEQSDGMK